MAFGDSGWWNTDVKYYKGDIITQNGVQYVAVSNTTTSTNAPPSSRWAVAKLDNVDGWQRQVYNPGDMVTYEDEGNFFTFVNIRRSSSNRTPFQQNGHWRVVPQDSFPLAYDSRVVYTKGLQISYYNQVFVNISTTRNNPYQNNNSRWRIIIPENTAPAYNTQVRYYKDDQVSYPDPPGPDKQYIADVNYNSSIAPNRPPPGNNWKVAQ